MDRLLFALLWTDSAGAPQCAVYEDEEQAAADALIVDGRVEARSVVRATVERSGRFERG